MEVQNSTDVECHTDQYQLNFVTPKEQYVHKKLTLQKILCEVMIPNISHKNIYSKAIVYHT